MGKGLGELLCVGEVNALIGSVSVGTGSNKTKSQNDGVWIHLVELRQERNGATHAVGASVSAIKEVAASFPDCLIEPRFEILLAPTSAHVAALCSDLGVVRNISGELFDKFCLARSWVGRWWQPHGKLDCG